MVDPAAVAANAASVRARIAEAAARAGRLASDITLVAVTKSVGPEAIPALLDAGVTDIAENRSHELKVKQAAAAHLAPVKWHFVGHLQRNKVRDVAGKVALIHSVDSERLLEAIDARGARQGFVQDVLIEVNLSGESAKHGVDAAGADGLCKAAADYRNVQVKGIMTMGPLVEPEGVRPVFEAGRKLFDQLRRRGYPRTDIETLSMGMTNDFEVAVEEGTTCVRIGTALFTPTERG